MTIRRRPEDFVVEERLSEAFRAAMRARPDHGIEHAVFRLEKTSLTTPEAAQHLSRAMGQRQGGVEYAGLKDKHAKTTQHVSIRHRPSADAPGPPERVEGRGWSATHLGWTGSPISAPDIIGNRFEIVVRDLSKGSCDEMDRRASLLGAGVSDGGVTITFTNYFGDQRFGSARHGKGFVASHLVRGEFEEALRLAIATPARKDAGRTRTFTRLCATKWGRWQELAAELPRCPERRAIEVLGAGGKPVEAFAALPYFLQSMYVEAFQSDLWNDTARRIVRRMEPNPRRVLRTPDDFGEMLFPASASEPWKSMEVPVLGRRTELTGPWAADARAALEERGLALEDLRIPGLRRPWFGEAGRSLFAEATDFTMTDPAADDLSPPGRLARTVAFELPRGSYATVVLRALGQ